MNVASNIEYIFYYFAINENSSSGDKESLFNVTEEIDGAAPMLPDDLDVDKDGNIYWSDASTVSHLCDSMTEMMSDPSGRLE